MARKDKGGLSQPRAPPEQDGGKPSRPRTVSCALPETLLPGGKRKNPQGWDRAFAQPPLTKKKKKKKTEKKKKKKSVSKIPPVEDRLPRFRKGT